MAYDMEEVFDAAFLLKEHCSKYDNCADCPLSDDEGLCILSEAYPDHWQLPKEGS